MLEAILLRLGAYGVIKLTDNAAETSVFTGHVSDDPSKPLASATITKHQGKVLYRLYIVSDGEWALVCATWEYPTILAVFQTWEDYVDEGGTVAAWQAQNYLRRNEIAGLEQSL